MTARIKVKWLSIQRKTIDPLDMPDGDLELWSIPDFDNGSPSITNRQSIGSSKKVVFPGDVLLSKIVPHIRRAWIVRESNLPQYASTEWLTFHSSKVRPEFLRYALLTDEFNRQMQLNSNGMGSLKRADPEKVGEQQINLPTIRKQKIIADFLDKRLVAIDAVLHQKSEQLKKISSYRQSLITRAVTKGLDPNVVMKASGVQWIGNMPSHWRICRVKNLFSVVCGATPSPNPQYWNGNINWIGPSDMDEIGDVSSGKRSITREGYESCGTTLVPQGSLVLSTRAPVGKVNIAKGELCTNQGCKSLVPLGSKNYTKYYYFVLQAAKDQLIQDSSGTTFLELSTSALSDELLPLPSLDEQKRIVSFLEKIDEMVLELKVKLSDSIRLLNEYRSSLISAAVTGQLAIDEEASA